MSKNRVLYLREGKKLVDVCPERKMADFGADTWRDI